MKTAGQTVKTTGEQIAAAGTKMGSFESSLSGSPTGLQKLGQQALQSQQSTMQCLLLVI